MWHLGSEIFTCLLLAFFFLAYFSTPTMESVCSSEMSVSSELHGVPIEDNLLFVYLKFLIN
jgi:hypothetical protein